MVVGIVPVVLDVLILVPLVLVLAPLVVGESMISSSVTLPLQSSTILIRFCCLFVKLGGDSSSSLPRDDVTVGRILDTSLRVAIVVGVV